MALKRSYYSWFHLFIRLAGLTGVVAVALGLFWRLVVKESWTQALHLPEPELGTVIALAGAAAVALALVFELRAAFRFAFSGRGAVGANVVLQIALAVAILAGVNVWSFQHYQTFDWTRDQTFTLPETWRDQLSRLQSETDIVVYLRHATAGVSGRTASDSYDEAAQKKIIEKVKDLASQFQELGATFHVKVLDVKKKDFEEKLGRLEKGDSASQALAKAIRAAPENSIFFQTRGSDVVQRLAFHDIYQLDRQASVTDNDSRGNLVLISQGVGPFARKVLNIEEKKPRIAVAVVHEVLGIDGDKELGMPGVKKVLTSRGYDYVDVILKSWELRPEPTVLTHAENAFEQIEAQLKLLTEDIKEDEDDLASFSKKQKELRDHTLAEINKRYAVADMGFRLVLIERSQLEKLRKAGRNVLADDVTEKAREAFLGLMQREITVVEARLAENRETQKKLLEDKSKLNVENIAEQRRISDLRAKFKRLLADADVLVVPRFTLVNLIRGERIPARVHGLDAAQLDAIKDYLKSGRPALFCLGPANEPRGDEGEADDLESLLASLGFELPNQTILYNAEGQALAKRTVARELPKVPDPSPANLDWSPGALAIDGQRGDSEGGPSPIRTSLQVAGRSLDVAKAKSGENPSLLRIRHPRPVYFQKLHVPTEATAAALGVFSSPAGFANLQGAALLVARSTRKLDESSVFLLTSKDCWNEDQPYGTPKSAPRFQRPKSDDPDNGTVKEKRHGPFPIGVAVETTLPDSWTKEDGKPASPSQVRVAVLGAGNAFLGDTLTPLQEKLFLDTTNWLLGRDDLLASENVAPWKFPRVDLSENAVNVWTWGAIVGLPLLFVYLGMMILLVRGVR